MRRCARIGAGLNNGFTLVELLAGLGILAILAVLTSLGVSNAIRGANSAKCLNNLRQLAILYHTYTQDNSGRLLASLERAGGGDRHNTEQSGNWQVNLQDIVSRSESGPVRRLPELSCPGLPQVFRSAVNTSYAMNFHICEIHATMPGPSTMGMVANPSQLVLFADSQGIGPGRTSGTISFSMLPVDWHSAPSIPVNEQSANLAFMDGRVARVKISEIPATNPRAGGGNSPASRFWLGY